MTVGNRKKKFSIKFELTPAGLLGVGVVCFCIFLWMFLLGVWAGQTVLSSSGYRIADHGKGEPESRLEVAPDKGEVPPEPAPMTKTPAPMAKAENEAVPPPAAEGKTASTPAALAGANDASYFTVQVGAYRDAAYADQALKEWRTKGYQAFSRPPEGQDDKYTRVYVGRFEEVAEARKQAESVERNEKIKPFIATIPSDSGDKP
jgi:cell division septation protein DedD